VSNAGAIEVEVALEDGEDDDRSASLVRIWNRCGKRAAGGAGRRWVPWQPANVLRPSDDRNGIDLASRGIIEDERLAAGLEIDEPDPVGRAAQAVRRRERDKRETIPDRPRAREAADRVQVVVIVDVDLLTAGEIEDLRMDRNLAVARVEARIDDRKPRRRDAEEAAVVELARLAD